MSRAIVPPEPAAGRGDVAVSAPLHWGVLIYFLYAAAVSFALVAGRPRYALVATLIALAVTALRVPRWRPAGFVALAVVPVLLLTGAADVAQPLVYLPPIALNLGLAILFGRTLAHGREPLITMFARMERGTLEADLARYTRRLTGIWVGFFVGAAFLSAALSFAASPAIWGWFVAVGNPLAVAALFLGEYAFRRWRYPHYRHASPLALVRIVAASWRPPPG